MAETFFERPILNSPYAYPGRHWELDADGQPTNRVLDRRRPSDLVTPVPKAKKRKATQDQAEILYGMSTAEQEFNPPGSSTKSAATSRPGATCPIPTSGR